jgi:NlpE-like protein
MPDPTRHLSCALVLLVAALGSCGRERDAAPAVTPMPTTLAGVYSGELPCINCVAIATTLWLRPDGRFFLRQRLIDEGKSAASNATENSTTFSLGRWHWDELAGEAVLRGAGPERRLAPLADERLELRVASPLEHVLARDPSSPAFADRLTLDGESAVTENGATFRECLTDLTFTVSESGAYRELRRQHRRMNSRHKVALTTVEGHLAASGRLVIDRFVTIKPGTACPAGRP